jgi:hypothetical protein
MPEMMGHEKELFTAIKAQKLKYTGHIMGHD